MQFPEIPLVVLDTETTGFVPRVHHIIEYASMRIEGGKVVDEYEQLIHIDEPVPDHIDALTRISTADLEGKPDFDAVRDEITKRLGPDTLIVGQNVSFDIGMLKGEGIDISDRPWIDTSMLASLVFPEFESYSLGYMSTILGLNHTPVHRALGDVRATMELFSQIWERLLELPPEMMEQAKEIMGKSSPGYAQLFAALPKATATKNPTWISAISKDEKTIGKTHDITLKKPAIGSVELMEEPAAPGVLQSVLDAAVKDTSTVHWIAVKNLESTVQRLNVPDGARVLYPPFLLIDPEGASALAAQDVFTADEATLTLKINWYEATSQSDFPIHGDEQAIWSGKLACTDESPLYTEQFKDLPSVILLDHRQLLSFLADPEHTAHGALNDEAHIIIDDASMLEDTATKAYGWYCNLDNLRAAAEGNDEFTKFVDLVAIWAEKTRDTQDIRYLAPSDLGKPEATGLHAQLETIMQRDDISPAIMRQLSHLDNILDVHNLRGRITYIEQRFNGSVVVQGVPEKISLFLKQHLYKTYPTTLLTPPNSANLLMEILPLETDKTVNTSICDIVAPNMNLAFRDECELKDLVADPPTGKTIVLVNSKRTIDDAFVKYSKQLEANNIEMICQGFSGGIGRTRAAFIAADKPALWLLTPWAYEGVSLPTGVADTLCLFALPFDHPSHAILSIRAGHYSEPFMAYSLPRMMHRLFRLMRTFSTQCDGIGEVLVMDNRIATKRYGSVVKKYLETFAAGSVKEKDDQMKML